MCIVDDCENPVLARGLCRKHYLRRRATGDPLGLRRQYAPDKVCAREGCDKLLSARTRAVRTSRFCSRECYYAGMSARVFEQRACDHCGNQYIPKGTIQRYCWDCLGPAHVTAGGFVRYKGGKLLQVYGVSWLEWQAMLARFGGKCWICKTAEATTLDHCHESGRPRGALCRGCNTRLHALEREGWLSAAQAYLAESAA